MRQPRTVLVYLFRQETEGPRYAVLQRADDGNWQAVSGGVEGGETLGDAARREALEETGLGLGAPLYRLDMTSGAERTCFAAAAHWSPDVYIVVKHFFAMDVTGQPRDLTLSGEHTAARWADYATAYEALRYDDDRTALWELDARLAAGDLPAPVA